MVGVRMVGAAETEGDPAVEGEGLGGPVGSDEGAVVTGAVVGSSVTGATLGLAVLGKRGVTVGSCVTGEVVGSRVTGAMDGAGVTGAIDGDGVMGATDGAGVCLVGLGVACVGFGVCLVGLGVSLVGAGVGLGVGWAKRLSLSQQSNIMDSSPSVGQQLPANPAHLAWAEQARASWVTRGVSFGTNGMVQSVSAKL